MSDLEGLVRELISKGVDRDGIIDRLMQEISIYKDLDPESLKKISNIIYEEVAKSTSICMDDPSGDIICPHTTGVRAGELGIGSRGLGDFFFHEQLRKIANATSSTSHMLRDDAGWIKLDNLWIVTSIDGIHSRLAYFPLIAGFHAARAAARDVLVKGAVPLGFIIDLRIADDGDPSLLLELEAGVSAVASFLNVPILSGSTLRIGGDMVIGKRIVGTVGCVGFSEHEPISRSNIEVGDVIVMTEGSGGGTITTAAVFEGERGVVDKTINFNTLGLLLKMIRNRDIGLASAVLDVTNGGLRGDLNELAESLNLGFAIDIGKVESLIDGDVLDFMRSRDIDPLGVSLDSILFIVNRRHAERLVDIVRGYGVEADIVGEVISRRGVYRYSGDQRDLEPLDLMYRESPYTRIKKYIGSEKPSNMNHILDLVDRACKVAIYKRNALLKYASRNTKVDLEE